VNEEEQEKAPETALEKEWREMKEANEADRKSTAPNQPV